MAIIIFGEDILRVRVNCYVPSERQVGINDYVFQVNDLDPGDQTLATVTKGFADFFEELYKAIIPPQASYMGVYVNRIDPNPTPSLSSTVGAGVGEANGSLSPLQATGVISRYTDNPGPSGRGRIYTPFLPTSFLTTNGELDLSGDAGIAMGALQAAAFKDPDLGPITIPTDDGNITVFQGLWGGPDPLVPVFTLITRSKVQPLIATQKRRGDYGQMNLPSP